MPKQTRTLKQWTQIVHDQTQSNLTIQQYCTQHALPVSSFYVWKKKIGETNKTSVPAKLQRPQNTSTSFIEISPPLTALPKDHSTQWVVELDLGNNMVLRVRA